MVIFEQFFEIFVIGITLLYPRHPIRIRVRVMIRNRVRIRDRIRDRIRVSIRDRD